LPLVLIPMAELAEAAVTVLKNDKASTSVVFVNSRGALTTPSSVLKMLAILLLEISVAA
jgi:hypothetical protein